MRTVKLKGRAVLYCPKSRRFVSYAAGSVIGGRSDAWADRWIKTGRAVEVWPVEKPAEVEPTRPDDVDGA